LNKPILNFITHYNATLRDLVCSKLTIFWHKAILDYPCRVVQLIEEGKEPYSIDRHKFLYDEISVIKFNSSDQRWWLTEPVVRCLYFINSSDINNNDNYYIDIGKIFLTIPDVPKHDIMGALKIEDERLIRFVNKQLNKFCDFPLLNTEDLIFYDFSIMYLSDKGKTYARENLKIVYQSYPSYIDTKCFFAIMSCLCGHAKKENLSSGIFNINPININNSKLVEDFYILL